MANMGEQLEERLIEFGAKVCVAIRQVPQDVAGQHFSKQLVRSSTSPAANYSEARGAESKRDFIHKMQLSLKELRETFTWLRFIDKLYSDVLDVRSLRIECNELLSIFVASITTAKRTPRTRKQPPNQ